MASYQLRSGSTVLVDVPSSSSLDGRGKKQTRRGTVFDTLGAVVVQYMESPVVGVGQIDWRIPLANGSQRGILQSASNGNYGDELVLFSPRYGTVNVAVVPEADGYEETPLEPVDAGYSLTLRFVRLD